ncbi:hypothetical protein L6164_019356 [Bauhinia variegata]|uniref:Uncharacterized protein n=1 Tax=Bauhinia variegata TaxID=167791 RepID=A0ACB9MRT4_BAUVA|nr:hypothetical protein L6164_019356 [Bauhinia variegata]
MDQFTFIYSHALINYWYRYNDVFPTFPLMLFMDVRFALRACKYARKIAQSYDDPSSLLGARRQVQDHTSESLNDTGARPVNISGCFHISDSSRKTYKPLCLTSMTRRQILRVGGGEGN